MLMGGHDPKPARAYVSIGIENWAYFLITQPYSKIVNSL